MKKHILVDASNLLHRAYFAFRASKDKTPDGGGMVSDDGYPTGMIFGSLSFLIDWFSTFGRFDGVHLFRDGVPKKRREMDPLYKQRDVKRESFFGLPAQKRALPGGGEAESEVELFFHVMKLLGTKVYFSPEEEADDLIASFVKKHPEDVHVIVSSDKDFFQLLVNPRVALYRPGTGKILDAEAAEKHWASLGSGHPEIPVQHVRMFKTLCGDSSDNIKGVFRLKKKVAAKVAGYSSVDAIAEAGWPGFSEKEKLAAQESMGRLRTNWNLVGLMDDLEVVAQDDVKPDVASAVSILKELQVCLDVASLVPHSGRVVTSAPADVKPVKSIVDSDFLSSI